jgi:hypothetical protein
MCVPQIDYFMDLPKGGQHLFNDVPRITIQLAQPHSIWGFPVPVPAISQSFAAHEIARRRALNGNADGGALVV